MPIEAPPALKFLMLVVVTEVSKARAINCWVEDRRGFAVIGMVRKDDGGAGAGKKSHTQRNHETLRHREPLTEESRASSL